MSRIRVLTSAGKWSDEICGLDKIRLLKDVIQVACNSNEYEDREIYGTSIRFLKDLEIDNKSVTFDEEYHDYDSGIIDWAKFNQLTGLSISNARMLMVRLSTLIKLSKGKLAYCRIYDELIKEAMAPESHPCDYCLFLRFEPE